MHEVRKKLKVAATLDGQRLDVGLTTAGVCQSRSKAQKLVSEKKVFVNGKTLKASYLLQSGDEIEVLVPEKRDLELLPFDFPLDITYEDEDVIIVNKPGGLVVHPSYGHESDTLINALLHRKTQLSPGSDDFRPGLVHRIDKGTSGLLVLAKNKESHEILAKQFKKKSIHRKYWALCFSHQPVESGTIETYIARDPRNRQRFKINDRAEGKHAVTHFKTLGKKPPFQLFELQLETGRTHQIRVHLSSQSNPIVGDDTYNGMKVAKNLKNQELKRHILEMTRFALHAKELGFIHPKTKKEMLFDSQIPDDLKFLYEKAGFSEFI